ncbi:MAG TPA: ATP-binding cassette domain-containing protein, partial [Candidatus Dormibacteraeota bacterium]|nr:ATP-binding cassette domain-containing protein [Candidatus Dormibacteraeota bacterium]
MTALPLYALRDLRVERDGRAILDLPALDVAPATISAVVGPNGAGKSTLLRLLAFLLPPENGTLAFAGAAVDFRPATLAALRRRVTYVGASPYLFHGSVRRNVAFGLRTRGQRDGGAVQRALDAVGAGPLIERAARTLSSGETQRVALARALACSPEVLLFDEPTANVDRASVPLIEAALARLPAAGCTVVLATHDADQARRLAATVIGLDAGRVAPAPVVTVLRGAAVRQNERWLFDSGGLRLELPAEAHPQAVAINADDIIVSLAPLASSARNQLRGRVVAIAADAGGVLL